ncbi:MAG TPA: hypothetical protein VGJ92_06900 [Methanocella sp.]|jgi:hypothetical protein
MALVEIKGAREVIDRITRLNAALPGRVRSAVVETATDIKTRESGGGRKVNVTYDGDGLGAAIAPVRDTGRSGSDAAAFRETVEKAVDQIVGGSG